MSETETPRELLIEAIMGAIASSTYDVQEMDAAIDALVASEVRAAKQAMPCYQALWAMEGSDEFAIEERARRWCNRLLCPTCAARAEEDV